MVESFENVRYQEKCYKERRGSEKNKEINAPSSLNSREMSTLVTQVSQRGKLVSVVCFMSEWVTSPLRAVTGPMWLADSAYGPL